MTRIDDILEALNAENIRATYKAVGEVLGVDPRNVAPRFLGNRRPAASWVVASSTGMPTGYLKANCHKELTSNPRVIDSKEELLELIEKHQQGDKQCDGKRWYHHDGTPHHGNRSTG